MAKKGNRLDIEVENELRRIRRLHDKKPVQDDDCIGVKAVNNDRYPAHCSECDSAEQDSFVFTGGDFLSYGATCARIKQEGIIPVTNPSPAMLDKCQKLISRCLKNYIPAEDELSLRGVYLYRDMEQTADLQYTFGLTSDIGAGEALIGISYSLLGYDLPVYHDTVFLHECCHLAEMSHTEEFQERFNTVLLLYYLNNNIHMDARTMMIAKSKRWKM